MKLFGTLSLLALALAPSALAGRTSVEKKELSRRALGTAFGYASLNGGTTGGTGGSSVTVTDLKGLTKAVEGDAKKIVYISGIIKGDGEPIKVGANTSILPKNGKGKDGLTAGGLWVNNVKNVIIAGLAFSKSLAPTDLVSIQKSTNVWVDHCSFENDLNSEKDDYDGQLDVTHASDFVTISWNEFSNSWKTSLVGHSDKNAAEDKGKLRITFANNYYHDVNSRLPSFRFGTGHVYNSYYKDVLASGINSRLGAQMLIENNYFDNVKNPIQTALEGGFVVATGNVVVNAIEQPDLSGKGNLTPSKLGYKYTLIDANQVPTVVSAGAGPKGL